jgi:two-component system, NtrC family, sensor kinase
LFKIQYFWEQYIQTANNHLLLSASRLVSFMQNQNSEVSIIQNQPSLHPQYFDMALRHFFEITHDAIIICNEQQFIECNIASVRMFGCHNKEDFWGKNLLDFSPRFQSNGISSTQLFAQYAQAAISDSSSNFEWLCHDLDGNIFWTEITLTSGKFNDQYIFQYVIRNIEERKSKEGEYNSIITIIENELCKIKQRFHDISEAIGEYIWEVDQSFKYTFLAGKSKFVKGYDPEELIGRSPIEFMMPDDVELVGKILKNSYINKTSFKIEHRNITPYGEIFWEEINGIPLLDQNENVIGFRGVGMSINKRKHTEEELRKSKEILQVVIDTIPQSISWQNRNLVYMGCNRKLAVAVGVSTPEKIVGKTDYELPCNHKDADIIREHNTDIMETNTAEIHIIEKQIQADGKYVWLDTSKLPLHDINGNVVGILAISEDITERKNIEEKKLESETLIHQKAQQEKLLNYIINQIRSSLDFDYILSTTVEEIRGLLQIDSCHFAWYYHEIENPYWEVVKDSHHPDLVDFSGCYPISEIPSLSNVMLQLKIQKIDNIETLKDQNLKEFLASLGHKSFLCIPGKTNSGAICAVSCSHNRSIRIWNNFEVELLESVISQLMIALNQAELYRQSQVKTQETEQALKELQIAQTQLIQSEKMSSLGQLVAGVAHEINNPVNFIHGNLTPAREYTKDLLNLISIYQKNYPQPVNEVVEMMEEIDFNFLVEDLPKLLASMKVGTQRIREIVLSLRSFSRLDEAEFKEADIHDGIDSTLMILQHRLKGRECFSGIEVIKEYNQLPLVECYPGQLNQVLMNIIVNAIDVLEERFNSTSPTPKIYISSKTIDHNQVEIRIKDNGGGMPEIVRQRLFDPFFTTKPVGKGTGMGLSISYQIITERHNGKLICISTEGIGSEFIIQIPVRQKIVALKKNYPVE